MVARMARWIVVAMVAGALASGCKHKDSDGLPPAKDWGTGPAGATAAPDPAQDTPNAPNPHAGLDESAQQLPPGHPALPAGHPSVNDMGSATGTDVSKMGLPPPDPDRPIDPTHHIAGVIKVHPKAAAQVKPGTAVFVSARQEDASGQPAGPPLAVEKLAWPASGDLTFDLTEANAMIGGTQLIGKVVVTAHYAQGGDPIAKTPGDVLGEAHVTVPADHVTVYLDQVL